MGGRCYTLDVNPTSGNRVKARLYQTRPLSAGGNVLLLQGQLSVTQFQTLEALLLASAERDGTEFLRVGRYYAHPRGERSAPGRSSSGTPLARAAARSGDGAAPWNDDPRPPPRAPWLTGPVIGLDGVVDDEDVEDDYDLLARRHVERMLRRG